MIWWNDIDTVIDLVGSITSIRYQPRRISWDLNKLSVCVFIHILRRSMPGLSVNVPELTLLSH